MCIIIIIIYFLTVRVIWGTIDDFATSFLHFSLFSTALWDLPNSRPVHSLKLSSHLFLCLPCLLPPFTVLSINAFLSVLYLNVSFVGLCSSCYLFCALSCVNWLQILKALEKKFLSFFSFFFLLIFSLEWLKRMSVRNLSDLHA